MKKGITPIVAIVILLLIAVAIAGAAYTYITGYWTGLTGKALEVTSVTCDSSGWVDINVRNFGQQPITMADDVAVTRTCVSGAGCDTLAIVKTPATVNPGQGGLIEDGALVTEGCGSGETCQYTITTAGRAQSITVTCT